MTAAKAIEIKQLRKAYGETTVLDGIDLAVEAGTVLALLGPNGAGKTTLVRILATLLPADSGKASVDGLDVRTQRTQVRSRISLTGQFAAIDEPQTGAENLRMMARLAGLSRTAARARAQELLEQFDLAAAADRRASTYSGGMRRRLDLAASLVVRPSVLFLDEPTTGLDPRSRQQMWGVVRSLVQDGVTVFLTTQYLEEADQLADRVAVLDAGRIVADGTPTALKARVAEQVLELTMTDIDAFGDIQQALGNRAVTSDAARLCVGVATDGTAANTRSLLDDVDPRHDTVASFTLRTATLDDVFLALTGHATTTSRETAHV